MKLNSLILFTLFSLFSINVFSQNTGDIVIKSDIRLTQLLEKHKEINQKLNSVKGYRIQIYFESGANSKTLASNIKDAFIIKYPNIKAYLIFHEPYYKIRVGDFRTRMEAQGFKQIIMTEYPISFVVKDDISFH